MGNWTPKRARAASIRKLKSLSRRTTKVAEDIAYEFGDYFNPVVLAADDLRDTIDHQVSMLKEAMDDACEAED